MTLVAQDIEQKIKAHITEQFMYDKPEVIINDDLQLVEQGIIDSVGIFQMIGFLEETFGIVFNPDEILLENFETIKAISDFVKAKFSQLGKGDFN